MFPVTTKPDVEETTTGSSLPSVLFPDFDDLLPADEDAEGKEPFIIDDMSKATWATARIVEAEERIGQRAEFAKNCKARIDTWLANANKQDENSIFFLTTMLQPYAESEIAKLYKTRTLSLPTGSISLRKLPDRLDISDKELALTYCETEHPEAVITKKELDTAILKDLIFKQAEPIPGVDATLGENRLYVKAPKQKVIGEIR
jgi:phage host-nuclease inhibitor protein Gam